MHTFKLKYRSHVGGLNLRRFVFVGFLTCARSLEEFLAA